MVYPIGKRTIAPLMKLFVRKVDSAENIPKDKVFIVASNHSSFIDDLLLPSIIIPMIDKKVHFYVNRNYFKNYFLRKFLYWGGSIPVAVDKKLDSRKVNEIAFEKAIKYLEKGDIVGVFPEGHRTRDGNLQKAKTGVAKLALDSMVPVLPIGIVGSYDILPKGKSFPRFRRCEVRVGKLMYFDRKIDKEEITRKIMKEIAKLTNQEYNY